MTESYIKISPSMLSADFTKFGEQLAVISDAGVDSIHWDVMDGNFVDEITFGAGLIKSCRKITNLRFDVHLMVNSPEKHIQKITEAGADLITVHVESTAHLHALLSTIKNLGKLAGVALNPTTSVECLKYVYDLVDSVTIMTVNPGKSGQKFIYSQIQKISEAKKIVNINTEICIDGGINFETIKECAVAGANVFVSGAFLFQNSNYKETVQKLRKCATI